MMIITVVILIFAVYYFTKQKNTPDTDRGNEKTAEQILNERYVAGEINEETYIRMKQMLKG